MVEAQEFPQLVMKHGVMGVPKTVINDDKGIEGAVPETVLLRTIMEAVGTTS